MFRVKYWMCGYESDYQTRDYDRESTAQAFVAGFKEALDLLNSDELRSEITEITN